jgi:hypothetical protein
MSDNMTPNGSESLTVDQAASNLLQMMNDAEDSKEQPEAEEQPVVEAQAEEEYSDDEYDSDDSESDDEQVQETPRYRVKVDGQETEVQLDELIRGYQREADYTKKTQTLAEQRKAVEADKSAVEQAKQLRDQYAQRLQLIEQTLSRQSPAEDLEALKEVDPIGYAVRVAERSEQDKKLSILRAEQIRIANMQQAEQAEQIKQVVASEAEKLTQSLPEYADPQKGEQVRKDIRTYAEKIGFSSQELAQVYDSRAVLTLYKAMQYDKLMANKGEVNKKIEQAPKMLRSGVGRPTTSIEAESTKKMKQQLRNSGKVSDAAKLFEKYL